MIPTEYRLERVVAGLIERLDGMRRSYEDEAAARAAFARAADEHLDAALADWADLRFSPYADQHGAFLRREVHETFLPRFVKAAHAMTDAERRGFGMGALATPVGRVGLAVLSLLVLWFVLLRLERFPVVWPLTVLDLGLPFLPDVLRALHQRRYDVDLQGIIGDMARIQEHALAYTPPVDEEPPGTSPRARSKRPVAGRVDG